MALLSHGSCGIADGKKWQQERGVTIYLHEADKHHTWLKIKPDILFKKPPMIQPILKIIHTPGHSGGSICLFDTKSKSLFTGDTCGGEQNKIRDFRDEDRHDDIPQRLQSCTKLLKFDFENLLPFHYEMMLGNAKAKLQEYIQLTKE